MTRENAVISLHEKERLATPLGQRDSNRMQGKNNTVWFNFERSSLLPLSFAEHHYTQFHEGYERTDITLHRRNTEQHNPTEIKCRLCSFKF